MQREALDARMRVMSIVWLGLTLGVATFGAVVYGLLTLGRVDVGGFPASTMMLIAPVLITIMAAGLVVGRVLESRIPPDAEDDDKISAYLAARIVAMGTQEGPALAVIAMSLVSGTPNWAIAAAAVALWTMFLARPRREDVERLLRR